MSTAAYPVPSGQTARRLTWPHLPPSVREAIEQRCGSPVVTAESRNSGFTPGFASVLTCEDGSRHFVKAASATAQRPFAESYRDEARKLRALPAGVPAAHLKWSMDGPWVVLGMEYVDGHLPARPWRPADLDDCLDALERVADLLTPVPDGLVLDTTEQEFADLPSMWQGFASLGPRHDEAATLAGRYASVVGGDTVVHTDLRDDNILLTGDAVVICDWNWPVRGAAWLDSLMMLIGPRGDGLDVGPALAERRLLRDVPAESIDIMLALLTGYFYKAAGDPVPATSPYIREHQRWQGDVCWAWLCERRGWS